MCVEFPAFYQTITGQGPVTIQIGTMSHNQFTLLKTFNNTGHAHDVCKTWKLIQSMNLENNHVQINTEHVLRQSVPRVDWPSVELSECRNCM